MSNNSPEIPERREILDIPASFRGSMLVENELVPR